MDIQEIRRANMRALAEQWGGVNKFAAKLGYTNGSFVVQMVGPHPIRDVTERTARRIEAALDLEAGWMDVVHGGPVPQVDNLILEVIRAVGAEADAQSVALSTRRFADIVAIAVEHCLAARKLDATHIKSMVGLFK